MDTLRKKHSEGKSLEQAVDEAIDGMDNDWVFKEYLVRHRAGVKEIMFNEKSIEEVREMVDKRISQLQDELTEKSRQLVNQTELLNEQGKNLSNAIAYVAKTLGISEKEAQERIASRDS